MQRRLFFLKTGVFTVSTGASMSGLMTGLAQAAGLGSLISLKKSPRMPVLFLGHGSPMNAIEDNEYRQSWQKLGAQFGSGPGRQFAAGPPQGKLAPSGGSAAHEVASVGAIYPKPQLILCISAHWLTKGWQFTAMAKPKTIHDFGGFPQELFAQQYPAPGAPEATAEISRLVMQPGSVKPIGLDQEWGFDHGTWSVLKPMFPAADIPVVQLSMDYGRPASEHFALGQQLRALRDQGVLIVGSGNVVHNLRAARFGVPSNQAYDWALEFDKTVAGQVTSGNLKDLADFQKLGALATQAHPSYDHYLPLLYAAGAVHAGEAVRSFNTNYQAASIAMRSFIWG